MVRSATVSAIAGIAARPRRVATSPSCATPPRAKARGEAHGAGARPQALRVDAPLGPEAGGRAPGGRDAAVGNKDENVSVAPGGGVDPARPGDLDPHPPPSVAAPARIDITAM